MEGTAEKPVVWAEEMDMVPFGCKAFLQIARDASGNVGNQGDLMKSKAVYIIPDPFAQETRNQP